MARALPCCGSCARRGFLDVILLTAAREAGALQEAMRLGVVDFILKPVVFERLRDTLDKYCQNRAALAALADIDQQAVDALLGHRCSRWRRAACPRGLTGLPCSGCWRRWGRRGQCRGDRRRVGVSRTTARRYLEFLVGQQLASPELEYGTVGRPERRYRQP